MAGSIRRREKLKLLPGTQIRIASLCCGSELSRLRRSWIVRVPFPLVLILLLLPILHPSLGPKDGDHLLVLETDLDQGELEGGRDCSWLFKDMELLCVLCLPCQDSHRVDIPLPLSSVTR